MSFVWPCEPSTELASDWLELELEPELEPETRELARALPRLDVLVSKSFLAFLMIEKCNRKSIVLRICSFAADPLERLAGLAADDLPADWITGAGSMDAFCWLEASSDCCCKTT